MTRSEELALIEQAIVDSSKYHRITYEEQLEHDERRRDAELNRASTQVWRNHANIGFRRNTSGRDSQPNTPKQEPQPKRKSKLSPKSGPKNADDSELQWIPD